MALTVIKPSGIDTSGNYTVTGMNVSANATVANLSVTTSLTLLTNSANLGPVGNVIITGGTNGYVLQTDGSGNLSWVAQSGGGSTSNISNGNSNVNIPAVNGNINFSAVGNTVMVITGTGVNVAGTLNVTGNTTVGNLVTSGSGGTLSNINVVSANTFTASGNITAGNASLGNSVVANYFTGNFYGTANLATYATTANSVAGANVSGQVANALVSGTVYTNAQPNITSVGTLTDLSVSGNGVFGGNLTVNGTLTYINSTTLAISDPIINLQTGANGAAPIANSGKDVGTALNYFDTSAKIAWMGWDVSNAEIAFGANVGIASEVVTFTSLANIRSGNAQLGNNVSANFFTGNGSFLTGITTASISNGNSNVNIPAANGNVNISAVGNANILVVTGTGANITGTLNVTGNATVGNIVTSGSGGNVSNVNVISANTFIASGNLTAGNINTTGSGGNIGNANVISANTFTASGNITAGNANLGNAVIANFFIGSGNNLSNIQAANVSGQIANSLISGTVYTNAQPNITSVGTLTGLTSTGTVNLTGASNVSLGPVGNVKITGGSNGQYLQTDGTGTLTWSTVSSGASSNISNGNSNVNIPAANGNINLTSVGNTIMVITGTGVNVAGTLNVTGNATVGNIVTSGSGGNVSNVNVISANTFIASGNLTAGNINTTGSGGNIGNANVISANTFTASGNITSGNANLGNAVTANYFIGNLYGTANLATYATTANSVAGGNVSGQVANALVAGTVYTNAQPNITSTGSLTGLTVSNATGVVNFTTTANVTLGAVGNLHISGGTNAYVLSTDGAGTLSWVAQSGGGSISNISNGNSNVNIPSANGNVNISAVGNANVVVITGTGINVAGTLNATGNASLGNLVTSGSGGNIANANVISANTFTASGNITANNINTTGSGGNIGNANVISANTFTASGNITAGNANLGNSVTANFFTGNGSLLTGITVSAGNSIVNGNSNVVVASNANVTISSAGNANIVIVTGTGANINGYANITGNLVASNITAGAGSGGNITGGNVISTNTFIALTSANFVAASNVNLGAVGNVKITGGTSSYVLSTDGTGNLSWIAGSSGSNISNGNSNVNIPSANGNINFSAVGNANVVVITGTGANISGTANVTGNLVAGNITAGAGSGGSITGGNLVSANYFTGTLTTNAQPNITSVGTLTTLSVTGNLVAGNITAGAGSGGSITGGNLVSANYFTGTLTTNAQPNITSVGTLTTLSVTGNGAFGNVNAGNLLTANYSTAVITTAAQPNITSVGSLIGLTVSNATGVVNFTTTANVTLGAVANLHIAGGTNGYVLQTDGSGTLSWVAQSGGGTVSNISNGNSNVNIPAANGNVNISAVGNANILVVTGTGINVAGTLNITGQSNLGAVGNVKITGGTANYLLSTDGFGNLSWAAAPAGANVTVDNFTGNGVQTIFTLSTTPIGINQTSVNYNGATVLRTDYTLANANITFSSAPANGSYIEVTTINLTAGGGGGASSAAAVGYSLIFGG